LLLRRTLHIQRLHFRCDGLALRGRHGRQTLCAEEFDAAAFVAEVGF
jgi:hypothetical protein